MSVIPAWVLCPHRVKCLSDSTKSEGFFSRKELEEYVAKHPHEEFDILTPPQGN